MKIGILASARTGSTSVYRIIREHLRLSGYICLSEPFNYELRNKNNQSVYELDTLNRYSNIVIKTFVDETHIPNQYKNNLDGYWNWILSYFDKIILLDRKDKIAQSESLTYHLKKNDKYSWQTPQYYELSSIDKNEIEDNKKELIKSSEIIKEFSKKGYPLYYYEDIFISKDRNVINHMFGYLNIPLEDYIYNKCIVSDEYKIRLNTSNKSIL